MVPKVSVIVPIYNVEKYLKRCIDSIINQTYENIEVILVNDGSTDRCRQIIEDYSKKDYRIKVIHKENGGLSDARNCGMKLITGEYVLFVDSDDWLKEEMIKILVKKSLELDADVIQSGFYYAYSEYLLYDNRYYSENMKPVILDRKKLMYELVINEKIKNFAWGKLYKKEIVEDLFFKEGVLFEDIFWAHKVMDRVNRYVILHKPMYYYRQRKDSIVAVYNERNLDMLIGLRERHNFLKENYNCLLNESYKMIFKSSIIHYNLLCKKKSIINRNLYKRQIKDYIISNYQPIKEALKNDKELKIQLILFKINYKLSNLYVLVNKVLEGLNLKAKKASLIRIDI